MGNHNAPELTIAHRCAAFVYDLDEDVSLRDVEITWVDSTGQCEHGKLGRTVEIANRRDAVRSCQVDDFSAKGSA